MAGALGLAGCFLDEDMDDSAGASGSESGSASDSDTGVPSGEYCASVVDWDAPMVEFEEEVLLEVNEARAAGANCGGQDFAATHPLTMNGALRCAARVHSRDMAERGYFDHDNPDGESPFDRMERAGYQFRAAGENIAQGYPTPEAVVDGWLESPGHCRNIMSPDFTEIGVGFWSMGSYWTQTFAAPL